MSVGLTATAVFGVLLQTEPSVDPNVAKPGWIALVVTLALLVALTLLFFSMRKQMRKITIPRDDGSDGLSEEPPGADSGEPGDGAGPTSRRPDLSRRSDGA